MDRESCSKSAAAHPLKGNYFSLDLQEKPLEMLSLVFLGEGPCYS